MKGIDAKKIQKGNVVAIIPARGGSKGVPKKNIRALNGYPLIAYSIAVCRMSKFITRTIISTDSEEIAEVAKYFGAEVPFIRPAELASDTSTDFDFMQHFLKWLYDHEQQLPEFITHMRPTTPLREVKIVDQAIADLMSNMEATCLRSAHRASESPYKWFVNDGGYYRSIINGLTGDKANNARQGFPDAFIPDGYVDVLRTQFIAENDLLHGDKIMGFESPYCVEVDAISDFEYLEYMIKKDKLELYDYLRKYSLIDA